MDPDYRILYSGLEDPPGLIRCDNISPAPGPVRPGARSRFVVSICICIQQTEPGSPGARSTGNTTNDNYIHCRTTSIEPKIYNCVSG